MRLLFALILCLYATCCSSAEYDVGGGDNDYATLTTLAAAISLSSDDIVNIYPGTYTDTPRFGIAHTLVGTSGHPVTIRGVDAGGNPVEIIDGPVVFDYSGVGLVNDGAFYLNDANAYVIIQGITIRGLPYTVGSSNVAMKIKSDNTTVRWVYFKDNVSTVSGGPECNSLTVEYCEFSGGSTNGTGTTHLHQLYSFSEHLTIRFSYFHDYVAPQGQSHNIKSRDLITDIYYNKIVASQGMDQPIEACQTDTAYAGGMPTTIVGNLVIIPDGVTGVSAFVKHSDDQNAINVNDRPGNLIVINNTFINLSSSDIAAFYAEFTTGTNEISNNIFYGADHMQHSLYPFTISGNNNWLQTGVELNESGGEITGLEGTVYGTSPDYTTSYIPTIGGDLDEISYQFSSVTPVYLPYLDGDRADSDDIGAFESASRVFRFDLSRINAVTNE